jgi:small subunit ribosomal protein S9
MAKKIYNGTGRRKASIAQVRLTSGKGKITVNGRDVHDFFPYETNVMDLKQPLVLTNTEDKFDVDVKVTGGGFTGQTGAIRLGIARALLEYDAASDPTSETSFRKILNELGL